MISDAYLAHTRPHLDAAELLRLFGTHAASEAAVRADRARALGNYVHFCRWRQVGRLIDVLGETEPSGTVH